MHIKPRSTGKIVFQYCVRRSVAMKEGRVGIILILVLAVGIVLGTSHISMSKEVTNKEKEVLWG